MLDDEGMLRKVAWSDVFPWLILVRCVRLAFRARVLFLSAAGILVTLSGWTLLGMVFSGGDPGVARQVEPYQRCPWLAVTALVPDKPLSGDASAELGQILEANRPVPIFVRAWEPVSGSWEQLSRPVRDVFTQGGTVVGTLFLLLCGFWALAVWAFFGGAVSRTTAVELAAGERIGWEAMLRFTGSKWRAYLAGPLMPLLGVLVAAMVSAAVGLLLHVGLGVLIAGLLWPLLLLGWALMAVLLLGLFFGWPLMWAVISTEGTDSFDALSRTYNYLFSRPLHAAFYAVVAIALGSLGWLLVSNFAAAVVYLSYWGVSWGGGDQIVHAIRTGGEGLGVGGRAGTALIRFWVECVKLLAAGFLYSYLWTAATGIYFLLRRDVDAREMDEVFLDEPAGRETYGLPPLKSDASGVPEVADEPENGGQ